MIFVDTSFWVALVASQDDRHRQAADLLAGVGDRQLLTSNHVYGETWTYRARRYGHFMAIRFLTQIDRSSRVRVSLVSEALEAEAWRWLRRRDERPYSFVDATSFALMRSLRIREALTFDADFAAAGFVQPRT